MLQSRCMGGVALM